MIGLTYHSYLKILEKELLPAMGCTEPISLALAASIAKDHFIGSIERVAIIVSENIIKNVKSVVVPNTDGLKGIISAVSAGIVGGKSELGLEVISKVTAESKAEMRKFIKNTDFELKESDSSYSLDIKVILSSKEHSSEVSIIGDHTNVCLIKKDGVVVFNKPYTSKKENGDNLLTIKGITEFSNILNIDDVKPFLDRQISYNMAIAEEGLKNDYGACIGKIIYRNDSKSLPSLATAYAAAASDARMSGCDLPVIINAGSGNQGLTVSLPVIIYANILNKSREELYRSLALANLINIHLKSGMGRLSAFCGATCAGVAAACGICFFYKKEEKMYEKVILNGLAINSGVFCDGAKASCAAKIASSVQAGLLGLQMALNNCNFHSGEGIISEDVEETIKNINHLAKDAMKETDHEIVEMMKKNC